MQMIREDFFQKLPNEIERSRLAEQMKDNGVYLLAGRKGSGKTKCLQQICRALPQQEKVLWLSFDGESNRKEQQIRQLLEKEEYHCLVFDNFSALHHRRLLLYIQEFLRRRGNSSRIFLVLSDTPEPCLSHYIAEGNYRFISQDMLAFSKQEIEMLAEQFFPNISCTEEQQQKSFSLTEGWVIAVTFLFRLLVERGEGPEGLFTLTEEELLTDTQLYEFIEYEIYDHFSMKEKEFMSQSAVLRSFDREALRYCLGKSADIHLLRKMKGRGLFSGRNQYCRLLRLFLMDQISEASKKEIIRKAGDYYLEKEDYEEAFFYLKSDGKRVRELFLEHGLKLLHHGHYNLMGQCIQILLKAEIEWTVPELEIAAQYYYLVGNRTQMEYCLNAADSMFGKENKYGMYRSLYRGLFYYHENPEKFEKQVNNALFFLRENHIPLPFLQEEEKKVLAQIQKEKETEQSQRNSAKIAVKMFGTFAVTVLEDGKELSWRTRKACELFAYLLQLDGKAVDRKTLLSELWQENIPNNAVAMLHNMFYNIRKELSYYNLEYLIQYKNKKYSMDISVIRSDLSEIRWLAELVEKKDMEKLIEQRKLFDTFWGVYLKDMDNAWLRSQQGYYEKIFERGCVLLGTALLERGQYEEASRYFKNALKISSFSEKIVGHLIHCYAQMGEYNLVKRQYEEFRTLLRKELNIEPGEELKRIYYTYISKK